MLDLSKFQGVRVLPAGDDFAWGNWLVVLGLKSSPPFPGTVVSCPSRETVASVWSYTLSTI